MANTSRVFEAIRQTKARLEAQSWPPNPQTGETPHICRWGADYGVHGEIIQVGQSEVGDDSSITWQRLPGGRDEVFSIDIGIGQNTGEMDEDAISNRTEELADVVQRAFFDDATKTIIPLGMPEALKLEGVSSVSHVQPFHDPDAGALIAGAVIRYTVQFRI